MKIQDVWNALHEIRTKSRDGEVAHSLEDVLWASVLDAIARGTAEDPQRMAELALASREIEFRRGCA